MSRSTRAAMAVSASALTVLALAACAPDAPRAAQQPTESPLVTERPAPTPTMAQDTAKPQPVEIDPVTFTIECKYEDPSLYDPADVDSSPMDSVVRVRLATFEDAWKADKPWDQCEAERSGGRDYTSEQIAAANAAGYTDRDYLKYIYARCAETAGYYVTDGPGSESQRAEVAGMLKLCPDFPSAEQLRKAVSESVQEEAERAAGTRFWGSGLYVVGQDVQPGTYETTGSVENCYWAVTGAAGEVIDNNFISAAPRAELTVGADASGLEIDGGCGEWSRVGE